MYNFIFGFVLGSFILEPIIINFVYFSNVGLFIDLILTRKNEEKLRRFFNEKISN